MARDRQRAKQRKARRAQSAQPAPRPIHRANVTGELDHASGEVDEFEAAVVSGGEEREADPEPEADEEALAVEHPEELDEESFAELEDEVDELAEEEESGADPAAAPERRERRARREHREPAPGAPTPSGAGRLLAFLRASWAELQRVQWPDRRQVAQATAVVIGFVIVAGLYLGLADKVAQEIVDFIL